MSVSTVLEQIQNDPRFRERFAHAEILPARAAKYGTLSEPLPEVLEDYLNRNGIRLYTHQCAAIDAVRKRENLLLTTSTASGKTLAFHLPILERLMDDPNATALYLYPTKALANDQLKTLQAIERFGGLSTESAIYDGDTPGHRRAAIRARSRILLSNPYELHQILPWHHKWSGYLGHLQFVVIDEAHRYRGIFGSHIALLLRRLCRMSNHYGATPQWILASATLANPQEFSRKLTGASCQVLNEDGSPRGKRSFVLYNPYPNGEVDRSPHQETKELFLACIQGGLQTLCFTGSRRLAELVARWAREGNGHSLPGWEHRIAPYRAGFLPEERRLIEQQLKEGSLQGVVSTNALELGVDIGGMDAVIISGFPGTVISTWQQAGRAGRRAGDSLSILVGFQNPLDQYFMHHPQSFFSRPMEHAIVDETNPYITSGHLLCAAAELPVVAERDRQYFGETMNVTLRSLEQCHLVRETPRGWVYTGRGRAVDAVALGAISSCSFRVVCEGKLLETLDRSQAFREGHTGAVLLHGGETYLVKELNLEERVVRVRKAEVDYYTEPLRSVDLTIQSEEKRVWFGDILLSFGKVHVTEQYTGYRIIHRNGTVAREGLNLPPIQFETEAFWFTLPERVMASVAGRDGGGGLHGMEHALIGMMPFHVMCDRWDIGGLSTPCFPSTGMPTVFVYDGCEGGIGLCEKGFDRFEPLVHTALELVQDCPCSEGCPSCIFSPKCGNENRPLDKDATRILLQEVYATLMGKADTSGTE
jgi:DEAD/DEAH box helicase domain-containing protein